MNTIPTIEEMSRAHTEELLRLEVLQLNKATGNPLVPYVDGERQLGHFHTSSAYSGHRCEDGQVAQQLVMFTENGVKSFATAKRNNEELVGLIAAFRKGIEFNQSTK